MNDEAQALELSRLTGEPPSGLSPLNTTFYDHLVDDLFYGKHYTYLRTAMFEAPQAHWFAQDEFLAYVPRVGRRGGFFVMGFTLNEGDGGGYQKIRLDQDGEIVRLTVVAWSAKPFFNAIRNWVVAEWPSLVILQES